MAGRIGEKRALVELDQLAAGRRDRWREWAVNMLQKIARLIVVAIIDERAAGDIESAALVFSDESVPGHLIVDISERRLGNAACPCTGRVDQGNAAGGRRRVESNQR